MTETLVRGDDGDERSLLAQGWDEGYVQAVADLTPAGLDHDSRLMFQIEHEGRNPYREGT